MRQFFCKKYAYCMAAMLAGVVSFSSCSNDDELMDNGPVQSGEVVKTQFAINVPYAGGTPSTRLGQDIVQGQADPVFRGMQHIKLIPFSADPTSKPSFTSDAIVLGDITTGTGGTTNLNGGAIFYNDTDIPVGTSHFLFYAEASRNVSDNGDNKKYGAIVAPTDFNNGDLLNGSCTSTSDLKFTLQQINASESTEIEHYLEDVLNAVTAAVYNNMSANDDLTVAYNNIGTLKAGSSASILAFMQDLYGLVENATASSAEKAVKDAISTYFSEASGKLSYNTSATGYVTNANNYPNNLSLPAGAAQVKFTAGQSTVGTFKYVHTADAGADFASYTYPAALYYFVQTTAKTSDSQHSEKWNGSSESDWSTFVTTNYTNAPVTATTQSVVLNDAVDYAVARFDVTPKFNAAEVPDAAGVNREVGSNTFELKGILIGGQKGVNYDFTQNASADEMTAYDASIADNSYVTSTSQNTYYSLALQTAQGATDNEKGADKVNFALELVNNGEDFYGLDGIVPAGGTFYLVGQLSTFATGNGETANEYVFEKDYTTKANVTINSLKNARNVVPDLRKTELELGLYVDLKWQQGLVDDVVID